MKLFLRKIIYGSFHIISTFIKRDVDVVILCYHSFSSDNWKFSVNPKTFAKQINFLKSKYNFITVKDLEDYLAGKKILKKSSVLLTIDDGYSNVMNIRAILKENSISPLLFLLSNSDAVNREQIDNNKRFLKTSEIKQLINDGWTIGSHTATHVDLTAINNEQLEKEIINSKNELEKNLGLSIRYFSYPRGRYTENVVDVVKNAGYDLAFSMNDGFLQPGYNKFLLPRIGVDQTHAFYEFSTIFTYWGITFRKAIKKYFPQLAL